MRIRDWSSDVCSSDFTDVSLQKARTASFFSGAQAGAELGANSSADVRQFVGATRTFLNDPAALTGTIAFADRSGGNLSRPYFPDGEVGRPHGPLSRPIAQFNPFSTGLQSALTLGNLGAHLGFVSGDLKRVVSGTRGFIRVDAGGSRHHTKK